MEFQWDDKKSLSNEKKHGVSFKEAISIFGDPLAITFNDSEHSILEHRLLTFGVSKLGRFIIVSHTERQGQVRVISARLMTKQEKRIYEED